MITSSKLWEIVDSWSIVKATPIQKFTMLLEVLTEAGVRVVFNTKERDPIHEPTEFPPTHIESYLGNNKTGDST